MYVIPFFGALEYCAITWVLVDGNTCKLMRFGNSHYEAMDSMILYMEQNGLSCVNQGISPTKKKNILPKPKKNYGVPEEKAARV